MNTSLTLDRVSRHYSRGEEIVHAVKEFSVSISAGEFVVLEGRSGSGKSTLLRLIAGFDEPDSGEIRIGEHTQSSAKLVPGRVGYVFQDFRLLPQINAGENVMLALLPLEKKAKRRIERAEEALHSVGLEDRFLHRPSQLSGGQQQRVAIARALVTRPAVILADEPTANLDSETARSIMKLLKSQGEVTGCTVVVATHDPSWAEYANRVITFEDGVVL